MEPCSLTYEQLAECLERKARVRRTVTYNDLAEELGLPRVGNLFANYPLNAFFEQIDAVDSLEKQPFRTALVVQKVSGRPGDGFFTSLSQLREVTIPSQDEEQVWKSEIDQLFSYYDPARDIKTLKITLTHSQAKRLEEIVALYGRPAESLVERTFSELLSHLEEEFDAIAEADAQIARGSS